MFLKESLGVFHVLLAVLKASSPAILARFSILIKECVCYRQLTAILALSSLLVL